MSGEEGESDIPLMRRLEATSLQTALGASSIEPGEVQNRGWISSIQLTGGVYDNGQARSKLNIQPLTSSSFKLTEDIPNPDSQQRRTKTLDLQTRTEGGLVILCS